MKKRENCPIIPDGILIFMPLAIAGILFVVFKMYWVSIPFFIVSFFVLWFFRNPERTVPSDARSLVSPADGKVIKVEKVWEEKLHGTCKKVSIFMNIFNVHVNRAPCSGSIQGVFYKEGKFLSANFDKASALNERNAVLVKTENGHEVLTIQIAGLIARRIVCWVATGMKVQKGERFGLIRFGSRLEVFMPVDTEILVKVGDKVKAGETEIGYFS